MIVFVKYFSCLSSINQLSLIVCLEGLSGPELSRPRRTTSFSVAGQPVALSPSLSLPASPISKSSSIPHCSLAHSIFWDELGNTKIQKVRETNGLKLQLGACAAQRWNWVQLRQISALLRSFSGWLAGRSGRSWAWRVMKRPPVSFINRTGLTAVVRLCWGENTQPSLSVQLLAEHVRRSAARRAWETRHSMKDT